MIQEGKYLNLPNAIRIRMETAKTTGRPSIMAASGAILNTSIALNKASLLGPRSTMFGGKLSTAEPNTVKLCILLI
jgi:hypothetical protein